MNHSVRITISWFTCFLFVFLLIAGSYPIRAQDTDHTNRSIQRANQLFKQGKYHQALKIFENQVPLIQDNDTLAEIYQKISYIHFKQGNIDKSEESLRSLFELDTDIKIDGYEFDTEYSMIYKKIQAEYWFSIRNRTEAEQKQYQKVIEKYSRRPEKKRNKLIPALLISGVAIAAIIMAVLIWKTDEKADSRGILSVSNLSDYAIYVSVADATRVCGGNEYIIIYLNAGTHTVELTGLGNSRTYTVVIEENQTTFITFGGWDVW